MDYPILMADIINSSKGNQKKTISDLRDIVNFINEIWSDEILSPLTITLGDEFQGVISTMDNAYRIIFEIEEQIIKCNLKLKLRYVLNFGAIETQINSNSAYEMLGSGLTYARETLNNMKTGKSRFRIIFGMQKNQDLINGLFKIYENYLDSWKQKDYHIVREFLLNKTYQEVAEILNINISSSWRRYKSLNMEEYKIVKKLILNSNKI